MASFRQHIVGVCFLRFIGGLRTSISPTRYVRPGQHAEGMHWAQRILASLTIRVATYSALVATSEKVEDRRYVIEGTSRAPFDFLLLSMFTPAGPFLLNTRTSVNIPFNTWKSQ